MLADAGQALLGLPPSLPANGSVGRPGARVIHLGTHVDRSRLWLRNAVAGLGVLAAAAAVVSFTAQYQMIFAARRLALVAGLEAAIPDAAALVFASLGIALALHGRRALRARVLNVAVRRGQRLHERDRRGAGLAGTGDLGDAAGRVRPGQRHADRRRPRLGDRPPQSAGHPAGR